MLNDESTQPFKTSLATLPSPHRLGVQAGWITNRKEPEVHVFLHLLLRILLQHVFQVIWTLDIVLLSSRLGIRLGIERVH